MRQRRCIRDEQIAVGGIVVYTLRPDQRPCHPDNKWRGKVLCVYPTIARIRVASLEEGYEGCDEDVWFEQVVRIEEETNHTSITNVNL
jgi:hypothetical protein